MLKIIRQYTQFSVRYRLKADTVTSVDGDVATLSATLTVSYVLTLNAVMYVTVVNANVILTNDDDAV